MNTEAAVNQKDMVLFQETLGSMEQSPGQCWHQGVGARSTKKKQWNESRLQFFAEEVKKGALVNRAVKRGADRQSTRGGKPGTTATRSGNRVDYQWT
ncbi:hypothetical protein ACEQPO_19960 [Bacillus sp. SL00103]